MHSFIDSRGFGVANPDRATPFLDMDSRGSLSEADTSNDRIEAQTNSESPRRS